MASQYHISSLVVQYRPETQQSVLAALSAIEGAEVHAQTPLHKLVVTLESTNGPAIQAKVDDIRGIPGVLSTVLVYQQVEPLTEEEWI
ncbi:chaperone NapD [Halomonas denitrificans]|nr:chaperone NapD [Halomonas denitrificans]